MTFRKGNDRGRAATPPRKQQKVCFGEAKKLVATAGQPGAKLPVLCPVLSRGRYYGV
jgi:hypothetical protein